MRPRPLPVSRKQLCAALRTAPVHAVAARYGLNQHTLRVWRAQWGIPAYRCWQTSAHGGGGTRVLALLAQHPDGLTQRQLVEMLGITKQAVSETLLRLRARGWVIRVEERRGAGRSPVAYRVVSCIQRQEA